jgi:flagellar motility protein MotE (MotC chaperone)
MTDRRTMAPFLGRVAVTLMLSLLIISGQESLPVAVAGSSGQPAASSSSEERRLLLMKQDLDREIERNRKILAEIDKKLELYRSLRKKNVRRLIRLYESMAPRTAASQINAMPKSLRLTLFSGMNPRKASRIMQYVDPRVAAEISAQMAGESRAQGGGR